MYAIGYDSGGLNGEETMAIVKFYEDGRSELVYCGPPEDSPIAVYSTPHEPRLSHQFDEMMRRVSDEIWQAVSVPWEPEWTADPSIELCRTCYRTLRGCECEVGGNV